MMIKKMLLPLLLAAPAARPNHIRKPNRYEGKYSLKNKTRVLKIFVLADEFEKLKEI